MHMPARLPGTLGSTSAFEVQTYLAESSEYSLHRARRRHRRDVEPEPTARPKWFSAHL